MRGAGRERSQADEVAFARVLLGVGAALVALRALQRAQPDAEPRDEDGDEGVHENAREVAEPLVDVFRAG